MVEMTEEPVVSKRRARWWIVKKIQRSYFRHGHRFGFGHFYKKKEKHLWLASITFVSLTVFSQRMGPKRCNRNNLKRNNTSLFILNYVNASLKRQQVIGREKTFYLTMSQRQRIPQRIFKKMIQLWSQMLMILGSFLNKRTEQNNVRGSDKKKRWVIPMIYVFFYPLMSWQLSMHLRFSFFSLSLCRR